MTPLRGTFQQKLDHLSQDIARLASLVDEAIGDSIRSLIERDTTVARRVIDNDRVINAMRYQIEEQSYVLLATQQPMARDLRQIASAISVATNVERTGDYAAGIARLVIRTAETVYVDPPNDLLRMAETSRRMLRQSLDAYLSNDADLAHAVAEQDDVIDELYASVLRQLLEEMARSPDLVTCATYLLWVAHNLERIGDRATNICERVIYVATGQLTDFDDLDDEHDAGPRDGVNLLNE